MSVLLKSRQIEADVPWKDMGKSVLRSILLQSHGPPIRGSNIVSVLVSIVYLESAPTHPLAPLNT